MTFYRRSYIRYDVINKLIYFSHLVNTAWIVCIMWHNIFLKNIMKIKFTGYITSYIWRIWVVFIYLHVEFTKEFRKTEFSQKKKKKENWENWPKRQNFSLTPKRKEQEQEVGNTPTHEPRMWMWWYRK